MTEELGHDTTATCNRTWGIRQALSQGPQPTAAACSCVAIFRVGGHVAGDILCTPGTCCT